jgi:enoyl-CoA hydratase
MAVFSREDRDGVAVLRFDRAPVNAIDIAVTEELGGALEALEETPPRRGLVLVGRGASFCAGVDFKAVAGYDAAQRGSLIRNINRMVMRLYGAPYPIVAAINGHAIGGGLILAMTCDARIASAGGGKLGLGEVKAGIPFPACPLIVLQHEFDRAVGRELALTGRLLGIDEARARHVLSEVVPAERLLESAIERAKALAALPAFSPIKSQLRAEALAAMRRVVDDDSDPMLKLMR